MSIEEVKISVPPSNNIFAELKKTASDYSFRVALSEIIDNSIGSMIKSECNVSIDIIGNWNEGTANSLSLDKEAKIIVTDDASGIQFSKLGEALSPACMSNKRKNSLHEHGMGLKTALRNLGTKEDKDNQGNVLSISGFKIFTSTENDNNTYLIEKMNYNDLTIKVIKNKNMFPKGHGTIVEISNLDKVFTGRKDYSRNLVPFLGQRYQQLLSGLHNKKLNLTVTLKDVNGKIIKSDGRELSFSVEPTVPVWASNFTPKLIKLPLGKGSKLKDWSAEFKFGYNPSKEELELFQNYDDLYKGYTKTTHPYNINSRKIDIFCNDILLCQKDFTWLFGIQEDSVARYLRNNRERIQIFLYKGFTTSFTKNDVQGTPIVEELKNNILKELEPYTAEKYKPKEETEIKDIIEPKLRAFYNDVKREISIPNYGLKADFSLINPKTSNQEIWEVKPGEACAPDFIQLLGYLLSSGIKNGVLLARAFNDNVKNLVQDAENFGVSVRLENLNLFI